MVESGATEDFIDTEVCKKHGIKMIKAKNSLEIYLAERKPSAMGPVTHMTKVPMDVSSHRELATSSGKCKSRTTVLLVQHPAPWSPWSSWSTLIHLGPQFPECGYTKWAKQDQGGPGVDQGHRQDHGAGWWTRSVQDHLGPLKYIFLMFPSGKPTTPCGDPRDAMGTRT